MFSKKQSKFLKVINKALFSVNSLSVNLRFLKTLLVDGQTLVLNSLIISLFNPKKLKLNYWCPGWQNRQTTGGFINYVAVCPFIIIDQVTNAQLFNCLYWLLGVMLSYLVLFVCDKVFDLQALYFRKTYDSKTKSQNLFWHINPTIFYLLSNLYMVFLFWSLVFSDVLPYCIITLLPSNYMMYFHNLVLLSFIACYCFLKVATYCATTASNENNLEYAIFIEKVTRLLMLMLFIFYLSLVLNINAMLVKFMPYDINNNIFLVKTFFYSQDLPLGYSLKFHYCFTSDNVKLISQSLQDHLSVICNNPSLVQKDFINWWYGPGHVQQLLLEQKIDLANKLIEENISSLLKKAAVKPEVIKEDYYLIKILKGIFKPFFNFKYR